MSVPLEQAAALARAAGDPFFFLLLTLLGLLAIGRLHDEWRAWRQRHGERTWRRRPMATLLPPPKPKPKPKSNQPKRNVPAPAVDPCEVQLPVVQVQELARTLYDDVARVLAATVEREPQRMDLRLKLIEVHRSLGDAPAFLQEVRQYLHQNRGRKDAQWARIADMGRQLLPAEAMFAELNSNPTPPPMRGQRFYEALDPQLLDRQTQELDARYRKLQADSQFRRQMMKGMVKLAARPSALLAAASMPGAGAGAPIFIKYEDPSGDSLARVSLIGQVLLAKFLNKRRIAFVARSGEEALRQAAMARQLGLRGLIFVGDHGLLEDHTRAMRIRDLGASLWTPDSALFGTAAEPRRAALEQWLADAPNTLYVSDLAAGPHPYPHIVQDLEGIVGREARAQMRQFHSPPCAVVISQDDGHPGLGLLQAFVGEPGAQLYCVDPGRGGPSGPPEQRCLREHLALRRGGRVAYVPLNGAGAEESAAPPALAYARHLARSMGKDQPILVLLSGSAGVDGRRAA